MPSIIVGTAGHIDHGKSALVRALTGTDPDRLPEEKKRGITIDLGFADLDLDGVTIGFVDVPGHERFVKNMLAGAHGIDVLALVIAADEGVMPQTREHFDICRLLGVRDGIIIVTKKDLVDEEMLALVEDDARELVKGSFLDAAPLLAVSARDGSGLDVLKKKLKEIASKVPGRSADLITRLPIDRAFSMKGFGSVVTGTLISGKITEGDELELLPPRKTVRVRGLQVHSKTVGRAFAGQRTAVNLGGVEVGQLERGMVLSTTDTLLPTQIIDAQVSILDHAPRGVRTRSRVRVHIGASEVLGRVRVLAQSGEINPGNLALCQLRLELPIVAIHGDRFIIRSYSPAETIGGGVVLDPLAVKHRGKDIENALKSLRLLESEDRVDKLAGFVQSAGPRGLKLETVSAATGWKKEVCREVISGGEKKGSVIEVANVLLSIESFNRLSQNVLSALESHHKREPLARGMLKETLREKVFVHALPELFNGVLSRLEATGEIVSDKDIVRLAGHSLALSDEDAQLKKKFEEIYLASGVEAPSMDQVMEKANVAPAKRNQGRKVLQLLIDSKQIVRVHNDLFFHTTVLDDLKLRLLKFAAANEPERLIDVAGFKELAGVSRKYAIPLLEYFDRERVTRRAGDKRLILK